MAEEGAPRDPLDDPSLLAEQARAQIEEHAVKIRAVPVPMGTEPPTVYRT